MKKRKWLSLLLAVMMLVSAVPFFPVTADAADGTVEVSTWAELKKALEYTTNCSVVKVVKDIETKSLNGHTGLHQDNIIFMSMAMDKVLDLNGHTVNAYAKYYSEVAQGYLINICDKDARLTIHHHLRHSRGCSRYLYHAGVEEESCHPGVHRDGERRCEDAGCEDTSDGRYQRRRQNQYR